MDPKILRYYNRELQHIREMGAEFAREYPKIAGRLGLEGVECADPYVERLLEGFAYLAARVQLKLDAEFPTFTQHLLQMVYPHYLAPVPSMAVVQFQPDLNESGLAQGYTIARHSPLRSVIGKDDRTPCEYRTAHTTQLWPLEIKEAKYYSSIASLASIGVPALDGAHAGLRLTLRTTAGVPLKALQLDTLTLHLSGADELPGTLYEAVLGTNVGFIVRAAGTRGEGYHVRSRAAVTRCGFDDDQSLIPYTRRSFQGYRLLQEYFAFPQRFFFFDLRELRSALEQLPGQEFEIVVLFKRSVGWLEGAVSADNFKLFCTPIINLVDKRSDRLHLDVTQPEYHIVADRTRPMDFEVYSVARAEGFGTSADPEMTFEPFYASSEATWHGRQKAFFTLRREPRVQSSRQRARPRSSYIGSEVFISLVDADQAPYSTDLRQLALHVTCTNRDLPLHMPIGKGMTDFATDSGAPLTAIRCVAGPTKPRPAHALGEHSWRLLSHLSFNYLSLLETSPQEGATALREMLQLYGDDNDAAVQRQIDGVRNISARPTTGRLPITDQVTYVRGLDIELTCDDAAFEGQGPFLLGAVLEEFFRRHVSVNSFTRLTLKTLNRGEVMRWPARLGQATIL